MVEETTPVELHERIQDGDEVQVVDIRPERAFRAGHIPGAINLPFHEFPNLVEDVEWGEDVVVACPKGESSLQAARLLESFEGVPEGARIANLEGGYREWEYDLEAEESEEPTDGGAASEDAPF